MTSPPNWSILVVAVGWFLAGSVRDTNAAPQITSGGRPAYALRAADYSGTSVPAAWTSFAYDYRTFEPAAETEWSLRPHRAPPGLLQAPAYQFEVEKSQIEWGGYLGQPVVRTNTAGIVLVLLPPGEFLMGGLIRQRCGFSGLVHHPVKVCQPFLLGRTEVTQGQWRAVMHSEPWRQEQQTPMGDACPATFISFARAVEFCNRLSEQEGLEPYYRIDGDHIHLVEGRGYFLPSEAEWEYACRAGSTAEFCFGDDSRELERYAWSAPDSRSPATSENTPRGPKEVASKLPNAFGLFDMHGNVAEWCGEAQGVFTEGVFWERPWETQSQVALRVTRGGSWCSKPIDCSAGHASETQGSGGTNSTTGFRVARRLYTAGRGAEE